MSEATNADFGFEKYDYMSLNSKRSKFVTDFALANYVEKYACGIWWLRSPNHSNKYVRYVNYDAKADENSVFSNKKRGIVPALCIELE